MRALIIGTRGSSLSLCQTQMIRVRLEERFPQRRFSIKTIKAQADRNPDVPLVALGGEGIFVKELETALLDGAIDLAVHSMKDLPVKIPARIRLAAVTEREDARDALVSRTGQMLEQLPAGAKVGTSSLRRASQMRLRRQDLELAPIRGNVDTRLRKLDEGQYDAIVVAAAGLIRLGLDERISQYLGPEWMLPEPGQGALGIEARDDDAETIEVLQAVNDPVARACVEAERAFLEALGGGCRVPIAALAEVRGEELVLDGAVIAADGSKRLREQASGPLQKPKELGQSLAERLKTQGALELLRL